MAKDFSVTIQIKDIKIAITSLNKIMRNQTKRLILLKVL